MLATVSYHTSPNSWGFLTLYLSNVLVKLLPDYRSFNEWQQKLGCNFVHESPLVKAFGMPEKWGIPVAKAL